MKKYFTFGLIMSLVSGACFAEHPMIAQLIREKQQKMEKLEKCKGTTKNLKIAGISTLGITAVGVGANIAEAVVLDKAKTATKKAEKDFKAEEKKKTDREAAEKARQDKCDAWNGSLRGNTCEISGLIKGSNSDVDSAINNYTSSTCSNGKRTDLSNEHKSKIEATCDGINVIAYVNIPTPNAEPKAETPAPAAAAADGAAQNQNGAKQADAKPGDKTAQTPADKKPENQTPAEKPEEVAAKKSDEDFMNACKNMGYRPSDKNSGELSCFYEVKTPTKKQEMESIAGKQVRGAIGALCAGNTLRDNGNFYAIYCGKGTLDHRLYITFKNIVEETPEAPAEETPEAPAEETPEAPAEDGNNVHGGTDIADALKEKLQKDCELIGGDIETDGDCVKELHPNTEEEYAEAIEKIRSHKDELSSSDFVGCGMSGGSLVCSYKDINKLYETLYSYTVVCKGGNFNADTGKCEAKEETPEAPAEDGNGTKTEGDSL